MDLVAKYIPPFISQRNIVGIVVSKPYVPIERREDPNEIQVRKFISDLCSSGKFEGLEYTYWCDAFALKHLESAYKKDFQDFYLRAYGLPLHDEVDSRVRAAVGTLQAYLDHFWDMEKEYKKSKK
ncbi:hypothetical protein QYF36_023236 [Acer negundo]|nr:hypothetical protein QYF36_023236 [Acer negundo]